MTPTELLQMMPAAGMARAELYAPYLTDAMVEFCISGEQRKAAFLAQICHESGSLRYTEEIADGSAYEGRKDLGNDQTGDGVKFKGRGFLQVTGRYNYQLCGMALGVDLIANPAMLAALGYVARGAGWWWKTHGCNELADNNAFGSLTKRVNGGYNGLDDRIRHWLRIRRIIGI